MREVQHETATGLPAPMSAIQQVRETAEGLFTLAELAARARENYAPHRCSDCQAGFGYMSELVLHEFETGHGPDVEAEVFGELADEIADHARNVADVIDRGRTFDVSPYEQLQNADQHDIQREVKW
jgi:hypothetical protein